VKKKWDDNRSIGMTTGLYLVLTVLIFLTVGTSSVRNISTVRNISAVGTSSARIISTVKTSSGRSISTVGGEQTSTNRAKNKAFRDRLGNIGNRGWG
jgi:hypothetical protein